MPTAQVQKPILWFYRLTRAILFTLYRILFRLEYYGNTGVPDDGRGVILAPNHASFLDPPILGITLKRHVTFLAKDYLFKAFGLGVALRWLGCLPIKSEKSDDFKSIRDLVRLLKAGRCTVVFPEGTRTSDGNLKEAEGGVGFLAIKSHSWVVPVYIRGTFEAFPRDAKFFKPWPVSVYYGKPFMPAIDENFKNLPDPYLAVSQKIMQDIAEIKIAVDDNFNSGDPRKSA